MRRRKVYQAMVTARLPARGLVSEACGHMHSTPKAAAECGASMVRVAMSLRPLVEIGYRVEYSVSRFMWHALREECSGATG